ncbi:MAG TPA: DUF1634 domain-containing protein [Nitrososphaerales archaeon]|nr:DUF1634 domain-containing protein [Nitrososphaerales archaeon]
MNFRDPESMSSVIGHLLRYGVVLSFAITVFGTALLIQQSGGADTSSPLTYHASTVPHGNFDVSLSALVSGLQGFQAYAYIELGVLVLLATPVSRVMVSIFLFAAEKDRMYVVITAVVLVFLIFSIFVTPLIPGFQA